MNLISSIVIALVACSSLYLNGVHSARRRSSATSTTTTATARCHSECEFELTNDIANKDDDHYDDATWTWAKSKWAECSAGQQLRERGDHLLANYEDFCRTQFMIELRLLQDVQACHGLTDQTVRVDLASAFLPYQPEADDEELQRVIRRYREVYNRTTTTTTTKADERDEDGSHLSGGEDDEVISDFRNSFIARTFARHKLHGACGLSKEGLIDQYTDRSLAEVDYETPDNSETSPAPTPTPTPSTPAAASVSASASASASVSRNNRRQTNRAAKARIVGGREVTQGEVPFQVRLADVQWFVEFTSCGGSLIDDRHILTAAHCVSSKRFGQLKAYVGDRNQYEPDGEHEYLIETITSHPNYSAASFDWDVAVLRTVKNITQREGQIERICLASGPLTGNLGFGPYYVSGWGFTRSYSYIASVLRIVDVDIKTCPTSSPPSPPSSPSSFNQQLPMKICTPTKGKDSCTGDSGGPLFRNSTRPGCRFEQLGIVSYGPENCGSGDSDAFYSNVAFYHDWIMSVVTGK